MRRAAIFGCVLATAFTAMRCNFTADNTLMFQQSPVAPFSMRTQVQEAIGAKHLVAPRFVLCYQMYFSDPAYEMYATGDSIPAFPKVVISKLTNILTTPFLNRGFALGYGNYVLGVAYLELYDDLNQNGVIEAGEPLVGSSNTEIIVYLQGTPTQELMDQFGALQQGYNLCIKTSRVRGVDLFQVTAPDNYIAVVSVPKADGLVEIPKLR